MWFVTYTITRTDVQIWRASKHSLGVSGSWGLHVLMSLETLILEAYPACCVLCWMYVDLLLCTAPAVHSFISRSLCQLLFKYQVELAEAISRFEDIRSSLLLLKSSTVTVNPVELLNGFCKDIGVGYLLCFSLFSVIHVLLLQWIFILYLYMEGVPMSEKLSGSFFLLFAPHDVTESEPAQCYNYSILWLETKERAQLLL